MRPGRMDRKVEFGLPDLEVSKWCDVMRSLPMQGMSASPDAGQEFESQQAFKILDNNSKPLKQDSGAH